MRHALEAPIAQSAQRLEAFGDGVFVIAIMDSFICILVVHCGKRRLLSCNF